MELLVNRSNTVTYHGEPNWTVQAKWFKDGVEQGVLPATANGSEYSVTLPYMVEEARISVEWTLNAIPNTGTIQVTKHYDIATPLIPLHEVKEMLGVGTTDKEAERAEASVRHVINVHTGQSFGKSRGTYTIKGKGTATLEMPRRIIQLFTVDGSNDLSRYEVLGDGFFLKVYDYGVPPVKADYHGWHQHVGGVIHNPQNVSWGSFSGGISYQVNALWGYEQVPYEVEEAARLLLGVYADEDTEYRDRYLTSMTAADWRIQFNQGAFLETGHVRADQLLAPYVLQRSWLVL